MGKDKKKIYTKTDMEDALLRQSGELEKRYGDNKDRIAELIEENKQLSKSLEVLLKKDKLVAKALEAAIEKAKEIEETANAKYKAELGRLKNFRERWKIFYDEAVKRYPIDDQLLKMKRFADTLDRILSVDSDDIRYMLSEKTEKSVKEAFEVKVDESNKGKFFDPMSKIEEFMKSDENYGFNLDDVLNPKEELDLEQLLKELGI